MNGERKQLHCRLALRERKVLAKGKSISASPITVAALSLQAPNLPL